MMCSLYHYLTRINFPLYPATAPSYMLVPDPSQSQHYACSFAVTRTVADCMPSFLSLICNCQSARSAFECMPDGGRFPPPAGRSRNCNDARRGCPTLSKIKPPRCRRRRRSHQRRRVIIPMSPPASFTQRAKWFVWVSCQTARQVPSICDGVSGIFARTTQGVDKYGPRT